MVPLVYVLTSVLGAVPLLWQAALLATNVLLAVLAGVCVTRLLADDDACQYSLIAGSLCWLVIPWNAPAQFWPTEVSVLPVLAVLLLDVILVLRVLRSKALDIASLLALFASYLWACMTYEAVYFQFIPVLLLGATAGTARWWLRSLVVAAVPLVAAQATAAGWHQYAKRFAATYKTVENGWVSMLIQNLVTLPAEMMRSVSEISVLITTAAVVMAGITIVIYLRSATSPEAHGATIRSVAALAVCLLGGLLSIVAFSLGGRRLYGLGIEARSFMVVAMWFVVAVCLVLHHARRYGRQLSGMWMAGALTLGILLAVSNQTRALDWAHSWKLQQAILANLPGAGLREVSPKSKVVLVNPREFNDVAVFSQPWEIESAIGVTLPSQRLDWVVVYNPWLGPLTWDGNRLFYHTSNIGPAEGVYIWEPQRASFRKATGPFEVQQNLTVVSKQATATP